MFTDNTSNKNNNNTNNTAWHILFQIVYIDIFLICLIREETRKEKNTTKMDKKKSTQRMPPAKINIEPKEKKKGKLKKKENENKSEIAPSF